MRITGGQLSWRCPACEVPSNKTQEAASREEGNGKS
jgi:hypothetical protein